MTAPRRFYDIPFRDFVLALAAGAAVAVFGAIFAALLFHVEILTMTGIYGTFTACMLMDGTRCRLDQQDRFGEPARSHKWFMAGYRAGRAAQGDERTGRFL